MKSIHSTRALLLCCSIAALTVPTFAHADAADAAAAEASADAGTPSVPDIVVTATRDSRSFKDVPLSVDVVSGEKLQKFNLFDAKDISKLAPGLELTNTSGRNNTTTLRGIAFDPDSGTAPSVQVYFNEAPSDAQLVYTALYDLQAIEVLRGPQGLFRGLTSPAGAITIATRKPSFSDTDGYVQGTATDRDGYNLQGGISIPLSDKFAVRVAGLLDGNRGNGVTNVTRNERSRSRTESGRITLGWRPSSNFTAYATYQFLHADNIQNQQVFGPGAIPATVAPFVVGSAPIAPGFSVPIAILLPSGSTVRSGPPAEVSDYLAVSTGQNRFKNTFHYMNLNLDWDLGPVTASVIAAHQFALLDSVRDLDSGNAVVEPIGTSTVRVPNYLTSFEARVRSNNTEGLTYSAGAFYSKRTGTVFDTETNNSYAAAAPLSAGLFLPIHTEVSVPVFTETLSFNAGAGYKSGPFSVEAGVRYTHIKAIQTTDITASSPGGQVLVPVGGGANLIFPVAPFTQSIVGVPPELSQTVGKPITGGATISYQITPELTTYVAYGHSFRLGSTGVATPVGISADLIQTKPEKTDSFEVGLKGSALDRRVSFAISAYYQKIDNYLARFDGIYYNCPDTNGVCGAAGSAPINNATQAPDAAFSFNANGKATIKGVELTLDARPTNDWDIGINAAYNKARYDNARLPCNDFAGTGVPNQTGPAKITGTGNTSYCISNGRLADAPDFSLTASSEIRFPLGKVTPFLSALYTYRPSVFSTKVNFAYQARNLLDLHLGVRSEDRNWEARIFAKNVLNEKKITNISLGNALTGPYDSGYRTVNVTNPREFGATISHKF